MSNDGGGVVPPTAPVDYPEFVSPAQSAPSYPTPGGAAVLRPGVIPLRPLTLGDIFNGSVNYVRANPKTTLGLTTVVVVITSLITLAINVAPLLTTGDLALDTGELDAAAVLAGSLSTITTILTTAVTSILLSGMLTVVIGRAVFGSTITIRTAWGKLRGRLLALIGLAVLQLLAVAALIAAVILMAVGVYAATGVPELAALLVFPLMFVLLFVLLYLYTAVLFAAPLIVLERLGVLAAIRRSFALTRRGFWRVLGIWLLAQIVAYVVSIAVAWPFSVAGQIMSIDQSSATTVLAGFALLSVGGAISQILTAPFIAGVTVFLYTDRRIRWEAFDLVLQSGAVAADPAHPDSTDHLWMVRRP